MDSLQSLPLLSSLCNSNSLYTKLMTNHDLTRDSSLISKLLTHCDDLDRALLHLKSQPQLKPRSVRFLPDRIGDLFGNVNLKLIDLEHSTCSQSSISDGVGLAEELLALVKEVAGVETVRSYAGQVLKDNSVWISEMLIEP